MGRIFYHPVIFQAVPMSHFSMIEARPLPGKKSRSISWRSREGRSVIYQIVAILSALALVGLLVRNTLTNMRLRGTRMMTREVGTSRYEGGWDVTVRHAGGDWTPPETCFS